MDDKALEERISGSGFVRVNDKRDPYERDRARMIHSSSFRRLQAKTQVLGVGENDFYRTRLTHSLEVAQIGSGIVQQLSKTDGESDWQKQLPTVDVIIAICLAHDLGHPPFGHGGEVALNYMMIDSGGFEGNGQTLRIISKLEKYTESFGMDLTRRTMLGVLKYPVSYSKLLSENHKEGSPFRKKPIENHRQVVADEWKPPKCYFDGETDIVTWILKPIKSDDRVRFCEVAEIEGSEKHNKAIYKSFDTSIMDLSDDIAYGVHDLEDAIALGLISRTMWDSEIGSELKKTNCLFNGQKIENITDELFSGVYHMRKKAIGGLVNWLITAAKVDTNSNFEHALLKYNVILPEEDKKALDIIQKFVVEKVIKNHAVQMLEYKGQQMVMAIFEAISSDPNRLLPEPTLKRWRDYEDRDPGSGARVVCDYVAGMTDDHACRIYKMLFVAGDGSIFHKV